MQHASDALKHTGHGSRLDCQPRSAQPAPFTDPAACTLNCMQGTASHNLEMTIGKKQHKPSEPRLDGNAAAVASSPCKMTFSKKPRKP